LNAKESKRRFERLVVKFGGSSLADGLSVSRAADSIVKKAEEGVQIVVVVSAMGKTTDLLIDTVNEACVDAPLGDELDDIIAMGERTSARIFTAALRAKGQEGCWIDPCDPNWPIITDNLFTNAKPILSVCEERIKRHVQPLLDEGRIVVVPGFIGKNEGGTITTMGRGGSDITALLLARALSADQVILVTDVEGIMTADPKIIRNPERLKEISMDALVGLADSGTKFIHKKALRYKSPSIDIKVISNSSGSLDSEGTIIRGSFPYNIIVEPYPEPAIAVTIVGREISESTLTLANVFQKIREADLTLLGMSINHNSLILYLPANVPENLMESLHLIVVKDDRAIAMAVRKNLAFIRVKGVGLEETPGVISSIAKALNSADINIYGIFTITSSILLFVDFKDRDKTLNVMKETIRTNGIDNH